MNVEDIFVEQELEVKKEEEGKEGEKEEGKEEGKEESMVGKSEIEEDLKDNKIFTDLKSFFNPQSRALQVSYLQYELKNYRIGKKPVFVFDLVPHLSAFMI